MILLELIGKRGRTQRSVKKVLNWEHEYKPQVLCLSK